MEAPWASTIFTYISSPEGVKGIGSNNPGGKNGRGEIDIKSGVEKYSC